MGRPDRGDRDEEKKTASASSRLQKIQENTFQDACCRSTAGSVGVERGRVLPSRSRHALKPATLF